MKKYKVIFMLIMLLVFVFLSFGQARLWYKAGAGNFLMNQDEEAGKALEITNEHLKNAKRSGIKLAILMVQGVCIPLYGSILATLGIAIRLGSRKALKIAIPLLCIYGTFLTAEGQSIIANRPVSIDETFLIYLIEWIFFSILIYIITLIQRKFIKPIDEPRS
jgi:cytochrome oxidase assembly protein ShyY1